MNTTQTVSNERTIDALDNLRIHQRQLDADGCEVGVSREALNDVILAFGRLLSLRNAQTAPDDMATHADIAAAARRMDAYAAQDAKPDGNAQNEAVAVKPLEWEFGGRVATATCPFGEYQVAEYTESDGMGYVAVFNDNDEVGEFAKSEEATLACQKHYEQRIRSALTHPAPPLAVTDEMVEALWRGLLSCPHTIEGHQIVIRSTDSLPGNAAAQTFERLRNSLTAALEAKQ